MADVCLANVVLPEARLKGGRRTSVPIGTLYLISVLREAGYTVDFRDYQLNDYDQPLAPESMRSFLESDSPVLGVSCFAQMMPWVLLAIEQLKQARPELRVVLGGAGPSEVAEPLLRDFPDVDAIVIGEGEATLLDLMRHRERWDLESVPGLAFRRNGQIQVTPPRERIAHLDALPSPAYDAVDMDAYEFTYLVTSRGCVYDCQFCQLPAFWCRQNVARSLDLIFEEIDLLVNRYGRRRLLIADDTFVLDRKRVLEFCRRLRESYPDMDWWCFARINLMDQELMRAMSDAGCKTLFYGVESGSNRVLKRIRKSITIEQAEDVIRQSLDYFEVQASYVWGFPFEEMGDFEQTVESMIRVALASPNAYLYLSLLAPLASSPIYAEYRDRIRFAPDIVSFIQFTPDLLKRGGIPDEVVEVVRAHPDVFAALYYYHDGRFEEKKAVMDMAKDESTRLSGKAIVDREYGQLLAGYATETSEELRAKQVPLGYRVAEAELAGVYRRFQNARSP